MQDYPEAAWRQGMLRAVYEWGKDRYNEELRPSDVLEMGERLGLSNAQSLNIFESLVNERFIDADLKRGSKTDMARFSYASITGLTEKGLIAIGEVPNPTEQLIRGFQAAIQSIEQDPTMPPDEKRRKIDGLNQTVGFLLNLGAAYTKQILDGIISPGG